MVLNKLKKHLVNVDFMEHINFETNLTFGEYDSVQSQVLKIPLV